MVCSLLARLASKMRKTSTSVYLLLFLFLLKEMASLARSPQTLIITGLQPASNLFFIWLPLARLAIYRAIFKN